MKLLNLFTSALVLTSALQANAGEKVTIIHESLETAVSYSEPITLAAGDFAEVVYQSVEPTGSDTGWEITRNDKTFFLSAIDAKGLKIAGPVSLRFKSPKWGGANPVAYKSFFTFDITREGTPSLTPTGAAVIPADSTGEFSVILESSIDLITWTPALPGDYGGNTVKRFFRTRIVKK